MQKQVPSTEARQEIANDVVEDFSSMQAKHSKQMTLRQFMQGIPKVIEQQSIRNSTQSKTSQDKEKASVPVKFSIQSSLNPISAITDHDRLTGSL